MTLLIKHTENEVARQAAQGDLPLGEEVEDAFSNNWAQSMIHFM